MYGKYRSKFGAKRVSHAGMSFASKLEAAVYDLLKLANPKAEIQCQATIYLTEARIIYKPDFKLTEGEREWFAESKGFETPEWRIKLKLYRFYGPAPLEIWRGSHTRPFLDETIIPKREKDLE